VTDSRAHLAAALAERYRIERELGAGGMATVYLAEDLKHHRRVAIKVLRSELAATIGPERFLREIRIAAQLQHPHILPLHDSGEVFVEHPERSGETRSLLYYVMPYVEGESLRERLARQGEFPVHEAVKLLTEIVDALGYAHRRGVVHRDIKPDNVMLSGRHALVMDFGVAKAVSEASGSNLLTTAGVALGTPAYMAPEQAAADPHLDHRVDIYAVGVMAFELLAGRPPFVGGTPQQVLAAHVTETPDLVSKYRPGISPALEQAVMRCLAKRPADRWQSADELLNQLELQVTPGDGMTPTTTRPVAAARHPRWSGLVAVVALSILAAIGFAVFRPRGEHSVALGRQSRITDAPGLEIDPVISPDGRFVAYVEGPYFQSHVLVRQLSGGSALDLTPALPGRHSRPRWAPGGSELLFVTSDGGTRRIDRISPLGGAPRTIVELKSDSVITSADWSPDGQRVAYDLGGAIYTSPPGGPAAKVYNGTDPHSVSWSPNGRFIAFVEGANRNLHGATGFANQAPSVIAVVPSAGGPVQAISPKTAINLSPTWTPNSRALFFISNLEGNKDVYRAELTSDGALAGQPRRLSTGLNAQSISLSKDGRTLAFSTLVRESNIWTLPLHPGRVIDEDAAVEVTTGNQVIESPSLSLDGRSLLFSSNRRGNADIYLLRLDEPRTEPEQLTTDSADDFSPAMSPDGREVLFHSLRSGLRNLWLMSSDGTNQRQLISSSFDEFAGVWSRDGRSIGFYADSGGTLWTGVTSRDASGHWGTPRLFLPGSIGGGQAAFSPDGKWLATVVNGAVMLVRMPSLETVSIFRLPTLFQAARYLSWAEDGRKIYYRVREPDGRLTLLAIPVDGGPPQVMVRERDASRSGPRSDWTIGADRFYFTIGHYEGDVWTAEVK